MPEPVRAGAFISGRSQRVTIPAEFRFSSEEVYVCRDPQTGDLILSQAPVGSDGIFAALDSAGFPDDFMADRAQGEAPTLRELPRG